MQVYTAVIKKKAISQTKSDFERNELMYNFLVVLRALIANRFCYICDWEGRELESKWGGGGAGGQETLPVGSGDAENVLPTVS